MRLYWCSGCTKSKSHPVGRSTQIVTAENTLTVLCWNPSMKSSPTGRHGRGFLFSCRNFIFALFELHSFFLFFYCTADIAIGAPFAGEDRRGKVFIYNGYSNGLNTNPSQVLNGAWASQSVPSGFGFTLRGDSDVDKNDYPGKIFPLVREFHTSMLWKMHLLLSGGRGQNRHFWIVLACFPES